MYENDVIYSLSNLSGNELDAITQIIKLKFCHYDYKFPYNDDGDGSDYGVLYNINLNKIKNYINRKILIKPQQFGVNPWGKVELFFELYEDDS
jgi:hypothetical protein